MRIKTSVKKMISNAKKLVIKYGYDGFGRWTVAELYRQW